MITDLDEIRRTLAAAPTAEAIDLLCDEIERLRAEMTDRAMTDLVRETERLGLYQTEEIEHLRAKQKRLEDGWEAEVARLVAERDAALAEVERLRALAYCDAGTDSEIPFRDLTQKYLPERDAWRACADQLYNGFNKGGDMREALAVYERLKGAES